jgi:hypothetical protein
MLFQSLLFDYSRTRLILEEFIQDLLKDDFSDAFIVFQSVQYGIIRFLN